MPARDRMTPAHRTGVIRSCPSDEDEESHNDRCAAEDEGAVGHRRAGDACQEQQLVDEMTDDAQRDEPDPVTPFEARGDRAESVALMDDGREQRSSPSAIRRLLNPSSGIWRRAALIRLKLLPQTRVMNSSAASRRENEKRINEKTGARSRRTGAGQSVGRGCPVVTRRTRHDREPSPNGLRKNRISEISST